MADTAVRAGPTQLTTTAATLYDPPAAGAVLRTIQIANEVAAAHTFTLSIGTDAAGKRIFKDASIDANGVIEWTGFLPLADADIVQGLADANSAVTVTLGLVAL